MPCRCIKGKIAPLSALIVTPKPLHLSQTKSHATFIIVDHIARNFLADSFVGSSFVSHPLAFAIAL
jgi:hypothetical protein